MTFVLPEHHPRLLHLTPYLRGDSLAALTLGGKLHRRGLVWGADQNGVCDLDAITWVLHWPKYRKQWRAVWTGQYVGKGKLRREVRIPIPKDWPAHVWELHSDQVARLRERRLPGGRRPHRARVHMHRAAEQGLPWILEVKHSPGYRTRHAWENLAADREASGIRKVGVMTLQTQWPDDDAALEVLELAVDVGGFPVALLPRAPKPASWSTKWVMLGVRKWGSWRAARR